MRNQLNVLKVCSLCLINRWVWFLVPFLSHYKQPVSKFFRRSSKTEIFLSGKVSSFGLTLFYSHINAALLESGFCAETHLQTVVTLSVCLFVPVHFSFLLLLLLFLLLFFVFCLFVVVLLLLLLLLLLLGGGGG